MARNRVQGPAETAEIHGTYSLQEAMILCAGYLADPSDFRCPTCGPGWTEILAFVEPQVSETGLASVGPPEGQYGVICYCRGCRRAAAFVMRDEMDLEPNPNERG